MTPDKLAAIPCGDPRRVAVLVKDMRKAYGEQAAGMAEMLADGAFRPESAAEWRAVAKAIREAQS